MGLRGTYLLVNWSGSYKFDPNIGGGILRGGSVEIGIRYEETGVTFELENEALKNSGHDPLIMEDEGCRIAYLVVPGLQGWPGYTIMWRCEKGHRGVYQVTFLSLWKGADDRLITRAIMEEHIRGHRYSKEHGGIMAYVGLGWDDDGESSPEELPV